MFLTQELNVFMIDIYYILIKQLIILFIRSFIYLNYMSNIIKESVQS
jgi:hypothetical protein